MSTVTSTFSPAPATAPDVVGVETTPRPTSPVEGPAFSEVLAGGARAFVQGASAAASSLPGSPLMAVALRGSSSAGILATSAPVGPLGAGSVGSFGASAGLSVPPSGALGGLVPGGVTSALGGGTLGVAPSGTSAADGSAAGTNDPSIASAMQQDQQMNLYYLQVQEQVNAQNRTYTALSNVIEVEHSTAKAAITNIHS